VVVVCRGPIREVAHEGRTVRTGIFRSPVEGPVRVTRAGLEGDETADLRYHGGPDRALLACSATHYGTWRTLTARPLAPGGVGENLALSRADEAAIRIGDTFRCGTALVQVTKPRGPCWKIGMRVGDPAFADALRATGLWGFYLRVLEEGLVAAGDPWTPVASDPAAPTVAALIAEKLRAPPA
jgi:MOSC domain-containing protein YiiM